MNPLAFDPFAYGLELRPEDLSREAAELLRQKKSELGDSIDSLTEMQRFMDMFRQTGGSAQGLLRPEQQSALDPDLVAALIQWIANGGLEQNRSRSLGRMTPHQGSMQPASWNGGGGGGGSVAPSGGSVAPSGGGSPASITPAPSDTARTPTEGGFVLPVNGTVTSDHGERASPTTGAADYHHGIDIAAPAGTPIQAAKGGTVSFAGWQDGYGNIVIIDHGNGQETRYAHASELHVTAGQHVEAGDVVASVGTTGNSTGNHLHFEIRQNGQSIDPAPYIGLA